MCNNLHYLRNLPCLPSPMVPMMQSLLLVQLLRHAWMECKKNMYGIDPLYEHQPHFSDNLVWIGAMSGDKACSFPGNILHPRWSWCV
ncbi:hypothetical protein V6N11_001222 [Hibiscus sabdariffa]|uniref:Uncharacterized protein n=1 Tax=Hibiscus sabdariffa TaxID=183260 RepID=A0ABR2RZX5_9ROSI